MARTVFRNVNLLDGANGPQANFAVVISDNIIEFAGPNGSLVTQPSDMLIDLNGMTLMPGMVHAHFHAGYHKLGEVRPVMPVGMESPIGLQAMRAAHNLELALQCGYTGVISGGGANFIDHSLELALQDGLINGPRFIPGSRDVSTTGHSMDLQKMPWWCSDYKGNANIADGIEGIRRAVREEVKFGAKIVKLFVTGGHGAGAIPRMEMTPEELQTAIETAHQRGARARGHIANTEAIHLALKFGINIIDHGDGLDDEGIDLLLERDAGIVPSMLYTQKVMEKAPDQLARKMRDEMKINAELFHKANDAGVRMLIGDDHGAATLPHGTYAEELSFYVKVMGFSPLDVIRWATKHGGEALDHNGQIGKVGMVQPGYLADILIIDGDPSKDVDVLQDRGRLKAVIKGGVFYKNDLTVPYETNVS